MSIIENNFDSNMKKIFGIEDDEQEKEIEKKEKEKFINDNIKHDDIKEMLIDKPEEKSDLIEVLEESGETEAIDILKQTGIVEEKRKDKMLSNLESNYNESRKNLSEIMAHGTEALATMKEIATESLAGVASAREVARVYEVYAILIKSVSEASTKMIELDEKVFNMAGITDRIKSQNMIDRHQAINSSKTKTISDVNINNAMFVGNTKDLASIIKKNSEKLNG